MILQALYSLAMNEGLMEDPDYEPKPVAWLVRIGSNGKLLGIQGTHYTLPAEGRRKPRPIPKMYKIPRRPLGKSGTRAPSGFLVENAKYVFGLPTSDKSFSEEEGREKSGMFRDLVTECVATTQDPGVIALLKFLEDHASGAQKVTLPEDCASNDLFAFVYAPDADSLLHDRPLIREFWQKKRQGAAGEVEQEITCLVSGKKIQNTGLFPLLYKVPGGSSSGVSLVTFNANAFMSYGWDRNQNASISQEASEACATALNRLLHPAWPNPRNPEATLPKRHLRLSGDTVVCFWAANPESELGGIFGPLLEANPEQVAEAYKSIWRGKPPEIEDPTAFYALTLTGTQGRAIVRDWLESTVGEVVRNLAAYFDDIRIVRNTPPPKGKELPPHFPLMLLLESLAVCGKQDEIPDHLAAGLAHAALTGSPFPLSLLQRALERMRAEIGLEKKVGNEGYGAKSRNDARAAIIKAVLKRNFKREVRYAMDPTNNDPGYLLGRLMAVIERMQQLALGDVNASVVDRFFSGASAAPQPTFTRLMKNMRHHARKAKDSGEPKIASNAHWLERQVDEIMARLGGFPPSLNLEQQGLFILGYHHQRNWLWMKKEEREALATAGQATRED